MPRAERVAGVDQVGGAHEHELAVVVPVVAAVVVDRAADGDGGHHHAHRSEDRQHPPHGARRYRWRSHDGEGPLAGRRDVVGDRVVSCSSVGASTGASRMAWVDTACSNRLRAVRPLPNPLSRVMESSQMRARARAPGSRW